MKREEMDETIGPSEYDLPDIKPPDEFTGSGLEIIGDPAKGRAQNTLHFLDGVFDMIEFAEREFPRACPETEEALQKRVRRREAERLARHLWEQKEVMERRGLHLRDHPDYHQTKSQLRAIPKDRNLRRMVKACLEGYPMSDWPIQNRREVALFIAVMELVKESQRPPTGDEVIDRMMRLKHWKDGQRLTNDGDRKNLTKFIRESEFHWLEFRPQGYQGDRKWT